MTHQLLPSLVACGVLGLVMHTAVLEKLSAEEQGALSTIQKTSPANTQLSDDEIRESLKGTWRIASGSNQGRPLPTDETKSSRVIVDKTSIVVIDAKDAELYRAEFTIDTGKQPYQIDMVSSTLNAPTSKALGIFKIDENGWTLCYGLRGERPTTFQPETSDQLMLFKMEKSNLASSIKGETSPK